MELEARAVVLVIALDQAPGNAKWSWQRRMVNGREWSKGRCLPMKKERVGKTLSDIAVIIGKRMIAWLFNSRLYKSEIFARPRKYLFRIIEYTLHYRKLEVWDARGLAGNKRKKVMDLIAVVRDETKMLMGDSEAFLIYAIVQSTEKVEGDIAEVGVYRHGSSNKGGSAKLICEAKGMKALHLFDIFEGIPSGDNEDAGFNIGVFAGSLESVTDYLKDYQDVYFHRGIFPGVAEPINNHRFAFVHLDVHTYESALGCLNFFYPRISLGGVIISHDILELGVRQAFDEFFKDKPEPVIESFATQALVVKTCYDLTTPNSIQPPTIDKGSTPMKD